MKEFKNMEKQIQDLCSRKGAASLLIVNDVLAPSSGKRKYLTSSTRVCGSLCRPAISILIHTLVYNQ